MCHQGWMGADFIYRFFWLFFCSKFLPNISSYLFLTGKQKAILPRVFSRKKKRKKEKKSKVFYVKKKFIFLHTDTYKSSRYFELQIMFGPQFSMVYWYIFFIFFYQLHKILFYEHLFVFKNRFSRFFWSQKSSIIGMRFYKTTFFFTKKFVENFNQKNTKFSFSHQGWAST